jgi:hypothetical protein
VSLLDDVVLDDRRRPAQIESNQAGTVLRVEGSRLVVSLEQFPAQEFACSWGRPAAHQHSDPDGATGFYGPGNPPAGTRVLVAFAGSGISDPWVIAYANWPA